MRPPHATTGRISEEGSEFPVSEVTVLNGPEHAYRIGLFNVLLGKPPVAVMLIKSLERYLLEG